MRNTHTHAHTLTPRRLAESERDKAEQARRAAERKASQLESDLAALRKQQEAQRQEQGKVSSYLR